MCGSVSVRVRVCVRGDEREIEMEREKVGI